MRRRKETIGELLLMAPWWVSVALGVLAYVGLRWLFPAIAGDNRIVKEFVEPVSKLAPFAALLFGILAAASAAFGIKRRNLVEKQASLETLRATSWKDFEYLVAEAYRRQNFAVEYSIGRGPDGGVDLVLRKDGRTSLVQCKQWKVFSVGAPVVREMFGLLTAEGADEAIIVTSGRFTGEAESFARGKPIQLLDGPRLLALVKSVKASTAGSTKPELGSSESSKPPPCPQCGNAMVLRTARRGTQAGKEFWGCASYPKCNGTRPAAPN